MGCEGALDVLDGFSLLVDHTGDWDIEDFDRVDDGAVEDIDFEFLGLHVGRRRLRGFALLLGSGGGGFDAGVEAREIVAGASCGVV